MKTWRALRWPLWSWSDGSYIDIVLMTQCYITHHKSCDFTFLDSVIKLPSTSFVTILEERSIRTSYPIYTAIIFRKFGVQVRKSKVLWRRAIVVTRSTRYNFIWAHVSVSCGWSVVYYGSLVLFVNKFDGYDIAK